MKIKVNEHICLELINEDHAQAIFDMVDKNRTHLRVWLPFVDNMKTITFAQNFIKGSMQRNKDGNEHAFVIFDNETAVGRIGVYKIDNQNKIGEIGYWVVENSQGKGIVTKACKAILDFCFDELNLNRVEIKCGTTNRKSKVIPERFHFKHEGIIRQGELLYGKFIDLDLYALLREEQRENPSS
jgi:ribosomal-protein-serine acetyltransferase